MAFKKSGNVLVTVPSIAVMTYNVTDRFAAFLIVYVRQSYSVCKPNITNKYC